MKNLNYTVVSLFTLLFFMFGTVSAQDNKIAIAQDTLSPMVQQMQNDLNHLKKLKVSGYIQSQYQKTETMGMDSYAGGNFAKETDNRFAVRRGRVKFAYSNELTNYVIQMDVTEKGLGIKDAYLSLTDPWLKTFTLTSGVFNRPFGFEIEYSSSNRESPERTRMYQTLFPGEREVGSKLSIQPWHKTALSGLKLDVGIFNGNGPKVEADKFKDMIAHLNYNQTYLDNKLKVGLGASYYNGGVRQATNYVYSIKDATTYDAYVSGTGVKTNSANELSNLKAFEADSSGTAGDKIARVYYGVEAQFSYDWMLGQTTLRGEYLWGSQPSEANSTESFTSLASGDLYVRNFSGYYFYFIQNILKTPFGVIVKYDSYDPNTDVSGNEISLAKNEFPANPVNTVKDVSGKVLNTYSSPIASTGMADIKYTTLGLGMIYQFNHNIKATLYYDMVANETTNNISNASALKDYSKNRLDNVITLRFQYKF